MNRDELKAVLASKANQLAGASLEVIRRGTDLDELSVLLNNGAALEYVERDPRHPRSRYFVRHLIVETYETDDFQEQPVVEHHANNGAPYTVTKHTLNFDHSPAAGTSRMCVRLAMFGLLLRMGAKDSTNNWRGGFFQSVLREAFWNPTSEIKFAFAKCLLERHPQFLANAGRHSYDWHGNPEAYQVFLRLGGDASAPGVLANALRYVPCADGPKSTRATRFKVIQSLLSAGAVLSEEERADFVRGRDIGWRGFEVPSEVRQILWRN